MNLSYMPIGSWTGRYVERQSRRCRNATNGRCRKARSAAAGDMPQMLQMSCQENMTVLVEHHTCICCVFACLLSWVHYSSADTKDRGTAAAVLVAQRWSRWKGHSSGGEFFSFLRICCATWVMLICFVIWLPYKQPKTFCQLLTSFCCDTHHVLNLVFGTSIRRGLCKQWPCSTLRVRYVAEAMVCRNTWSNVQNLPIQLVVDIFVLSVKTCHKKSYASKKFHKVLHYCMLSWTSKQDASSYAFSMGIVKCGRHTQPFKSQLFWETTVANPAVSHSYTSLTPLWRAEG